MCAQLGAHIVADLPLSQELRALCRTHGQSDPLTAYLESRVGFWL
ncbi:hypothetical protein [uncultured Helicobacter sp.]